MEREKEQMLREKEELMLRLQDYEQKTKRAERGQELLLPACPSHPTPTATQGLAVSQGSQTGLAYSQEGACSRGLSLLSTVP